MTSSAVTAQLDVLLHGIEAVYTREELERRLGAGEKLRVKLGLDPTAPDLHLGHTVVLRKLRQFQDFGHKAVLVIGGYTAMIGDPTGKSKTRPALDLAEIERNAQTYLAQAGKVLDTSADKLEIRNNADWLLPLTSVDVLKLMAQMTVARMLERDTFAKRQADGKEIYLHELLYPLMQAHDSVEIEASVELGGTDQTFNNLCGRDFQRNAGQPPQVVVIMPILVGTDGHDKMSKSLGNSVGITDAPGDMFGKIMSIPDDCLRNYFDLLTDVPPTEFEELLDPARHNPRDTKEHLAKTIITQYHSAKAAEGAADEFRRVHGGGGGLPDDVPEVKLPAESVQGGTIEAVDLVIQCGFADSRGAARRLINERGVRLNGAVIEDPLRCVTVKSGDVFQRGKRKFLRLVVP